MPRRYFFHIALADIVDDHGRRQMSTREQADALRADADWSDLSLEGKHLGRVRTLSVQGERVDMEAEVRGDQMPPLIELGRFKAEVNGKRSALLEKFTIMARTHIDRTEEM